MVRALASHQCGSGSIPILGVICGLSLLLVLVLAPRGFSPAGHSGFSLSTNTNISKLQFDQESVPILYSAFDHLVMELYAIQIYQLLLLFVCFFF